MLLLVAFHVLLSSILLYEILLFFKFSLLDMCSRIPGLL